MTPADIERLWHEVGLPQYFLGNGGTNHKLYSFADLILERAAKAVEKRAEERWLEHAITEFDTNASYYPGSIEGEYVTRDEEDESCAQEIRLLKVVTQPSSKQNPKPEVPVEVAAETPSQSPPLDAGTSGKGSVQASLFDDSAKEVKGNPHSGDVKPDHIGLVGGHHYAGCVDSENFFTSDCSYGCGCWMGGSRSGGPDGIDPFGYCPKAEEATR